MKTIDRTKGRADPDGKTVWYAGQLLTVEGKGWTDTGAFFERLPARAKTLVRPPVWDLSRNTAGISIRFATDAASIQVRWRPLAEGVAWPHMTPTGISDVDLYGRDEAGAWRFLAAGFPTGVENTSSFALDGRCEYLLYLPLYNGVTSVEIGVPATRSICLPPPSARDSRQPVVIYGTSIVQGGCASRPGLAWASIVGRRIDRPVINLGFSGNGQMEPELADLLSELEPPLFVLDALWNMSPELVAERVEPFVLKLREARPATPILLAEDSNNRGISPTAKGRVLREVLGKLGKARVGNLHFLPNTGMLGDDLEGTVDGCHPNDLGMSRHADVFAPAMAKLLKH